MQASPRNHARRAAWLCAALLLVLAACGGDEPVVVAPEAPDPRAAWGGTGRMVPNLGRYPREQFFIERDLFLPANDPATVPAEQVGFLRPDDEVFGVVVAGQARAYPVRMISYHHVVNDVIRGIPVAITY